MYILAGVPTHWRTGGQDASDDAAFVDLWLNDVDAIMPWTVGRYRDSDQATGYATDVMQEDMELLRRCQRSGGRCVNLIPVVLPGATVRNILVVFKGSVNSRSGDY